MQKVCNYEHEARSSNEVAPIEACSKEEGFPCSQQNDSDREENCLARRLEFLCLSKTCRHFTYQELQSATSGFSTGCICSFPHGVFHFCASVLNGKFPLKCILTL